MLKSDLRKIYLAKQNQLSPSERLQKSKQISESFFNNFSLETVQIVHLFLSIEKNKEIETKFFYERLWQDFPHIKTLIPRVNKKADELESLEFTSETKLDLSSWQIPEPIGNSLINADQIDIVLVPLLCYDQKGFRVGYGKGYYDKFFTNCRSDCLKIGLSYFSPIEKISDINEFDVTLDYCITPNKIWKFQTIF